MPRGVVRTFATNVLWSAVLGGLGALLVLAGARWLPGADGPVHEAGWTQRSRALFVPAGFYGAELDQGSGAHFSWTGASATLSFPELNRARAYRITLRLRSGRPPGVAPAQLSIAIDGRPRLLERVTDASQSIVFEIPRSSSRGATVTLETAPVYQPGGPDPRALGVIVDGVRAEPVNGTFVPATRVLLFVAGAVFCVALGLSLAGARRALAIGLGVATAAAFAWLVVTDAAFAGGYAERLLRIAAGALVAGSVVGLIQFKWPEVGGAGNWSSAAAILIALTTIKVAMFWHPLIVVGDGIFQVHRAQVVHGGQYIFTSVTPKPFFEFPYPVALYVFAQPFWSWFPAELDLLRLLRCVAIVMDAFVGLALFGAVRRVWPATSAALACAALWPFARAPLEALCNANLTNLFGQSAFGAGLAGIAWLAATGRMQAAGVAAAILFIVIAFLSHFGTVTVGLAILAAVAAVLFLFGEGAIRRAGLWVVGITIVAALVSWFAYYSDDQFIAVYKNTWASVTSQQADDSSKVVASPGVKVQRWWSGTGDDYGRPGVAVLLAAFAGAVVLLRRYARHGTSLVFLSWLVAWIALTILGVLTPFTLRANLAAAPALIALSAIAIGALSSRSRPLAAVVGAAVAWDGLEVARRCLELTTHH